MYCWHWSFSLALSLGKLRKGINFWPSLEVCQFILNVIPFFQLPTPFFKSSNVSARSNSYFVFQAVNDLLDCNLFPRWTLSSASRSSSVKTCLWLRIYLTRVFIYSNSISSLVTIILKVPELRRFLAFAWDFGTGNFRYFQFCLLPFALSSSPFIFSKMLKPLQKSWRRRGIPISLDDGLGGGADHVSAKLNSLIIHSDLLKSGFVPNEDKSLWEPVQIIT